MDWHIPLVVATAAFLAFMVLRVWPARGGESSTQARADLKEARRKLDAAKTDAERVDALCDAGDASAKLVGGAARAVQYYLRAMKLAPTSTDLVERVAKALARRPRGLENILWRRLGTESWAKEELPAVLAAIALLERLYAGPLKSTVRARAFANLRAHLKAQ